MQDKFEKEVFPAKFGATVVITIRADLTPTVLTMRPSSGRSEVFVLCTFRVAYAALYLIEIGHCLATPKRDTVRMADKELATAHGWKGTAKTSQRCGVVGLGCVLRAC